MSDDCPNLKWLSIPEEEWTLPFVVDDTEIIPAAIYETLRFTEDLEGIGDFNFGSRWDTLTRREKFVFGFKFDWSTGKILKREGLPDAIEEGLAFLNSCDRDAPALRKPDSDKSKPKRFKSVALTGIKGPPQPWPASDWIPFTGEQRNYECEISIKLDLAKKDNETLKRDFGIVLEMIRGIYGTPDGRARSRLPVSCKNILMAIARCRVLPDLRTEYPKEMSQEAAIEEIEFRGEKNALGSDLRTWKSSESLVRKFRESIPI